MTAARGDCSRIVSFLKESTHKSPHSNDDGYLHYNALDVNISHRFSGGLQMLAGYTWSHTLDNVDPDTTSQNPNDTNFTKRQEYGPAIYDQRQRFVLSGAYIIPSSKFTSAA